MNAKEHFEKQRPSSIGYDQFTISKETAIGLMEQYAKEMAREMTDRCFRKFFNVATPEPNVTKWFEKEIEYLLTKQK
jgi:hypothetical protein